MASEQKNTPIVKTQDERAPPYSAQPVQQFVQQNPQGFVQLHPYDRGYLNQQQGGLSNIDYGYDQPMSLPVPSSNNNDTVVVSQPQSSHILVNQKPDSNMVLAILSCFCCCWLLGIGAIIASAVSQSQSAEMRYDKARKSANVSRVLSIMSMIIGILLYITIIVLRTNTKFTGSDYHT